MENFESIIFQCPDNYRDNLIRHIQNLLKDRINKQEGSLVDYWTDLPDAEKRKADLLGSVRVCKELDQYLGTLKEQ